MKHPHSSRRAESSVLWLGWLTVVIGVFFFEHLFLGRSLLPLDVLNQMLLPREPGAAIEVQTHYPIDEITQLAPNAGWWRESLRRGEFPLWNPHLLGGHPQHGATGWTLLCPFKLPLLLPLPLERAYTLTLVGQFWLAGVFMFVLLRELGRSPPAACLGGVAWALCSNFLMFHWLFLNVFTWVPLLLTCWERARRQDSLAWAFASAVVMALAFLGGSIQMVAYVGFLWGFWACAELDWARPREGLRLGIWMLGVFATAALLCAVQWLPLAEFLPRETQRLRQLDPGAFGFKHALLGPPAALIMMLFPALAGSPQTFDLLKVIRGNAIDFTAYAGVLSVLLAGFGLLGPRDRRTRNLLALIAVVWLLVFFTPLQKFLYHRFLLLAVFAVVLLAAQGLDRLASGSVPSVHLRRAFWLATTSALVLEVGLGVASLWIGSRGALLTSRMEPMVLAGAASNQFGIHSAWLLGRVPRLLAHFHPSNPSLLVPALVLVGWAAAVKWSLRGPDRWRCLAWVTLLGVSLDLSVTLRDRVPRIEVARFPAYPLPTVLQSLRSDPDWFRVYRWMPGDRLTLMDNLGWAWGLNQVSGYESMAPDGLSRLPLGETNGFNRLLDLVAAKYVIAAATNELPAPRFVPVAQQHGVRLWRNSTWNPLVTFVTNAVAVPDAAAALTRLTDAQFDPRQTVVLTGLHLTRPPSSSGEVPPVTPWVRLHDRTAQHVRAEVSAPVAGYAVFAETSYPGWRAYVDGVPAPLLPADAYLQATPVPVGVHQVEFRFQPRSFRVGTQVSLAALGLGLAVTGWSVRRQRKSLRLDGGAR